MPAIRESLNTNCSLCAVVWMSLQNLLKFNIVIVTVLGGESFRRWLGHGFTLMHGLTPYLGRRLVTLGVWPPFSLSRKLSLCVMPSATLWHNKMWSLHFALPSLQNRESNKSLYKLPSVVLCCSSRKRTRILCKARCCSLGSNFLYHVKCSPAESREEFWVHLTSFYFIHSHMSVLFSKTQK